MNLWVRLWVIALPILSVGRTLVASEEGAAFLKIPIGAAAVGMGRAYTALATGADALNWNPAGIALNSLSFSHQQLFSSNELDHIGATASVGRGALGVSVIRLSYQSSDQRNEQGQKIGTVGAEDLAVGFAGAYNFNAFRLGAQVKVVRQRLASNTAQALAADLGVVSRTALPNLSVGLAARNIGSDLRYESESYSLPSTISMGGVYRVGGPLVLTADLQSSLHRDNLAFAFGGQLQLASAISVRGGYLSSLTHPASGLKGSESSDFGIGNFSGGLGLKLGQFSMDYAVQPFGELGNSQLITLASSFGGNSRDLQQSPEDEHWRLQVDDDRGNLKSLSR